MIKLEAFCPIRNHQALYSPIDVECLPGTITVIMGKSGIGKTSIFDSIRNRCQYQGQVNTNGKLFNITQNTNQFFPWFTVRKNLDICNASSKDEYIRLSKKWQIDHLLDRKPLQLSGGQQQRFLLIMAMCSGRENLLCDEALSSVDRITAIEIAKDFKSVAKTNHQSIIWITHDHEEADTLADQLIIL